MNGESVTVYNGEVWDVEGPADASGAPKLIPAGGKATSLEGAVAAKKKNEAQGGTKSEMDKAVEEQEDTLKKIQDQIDALAGALNAHTRHREIGNLTGCDPQDLRKDSHWTTFEI